MFLSLSSTPPCSTHSHIVTSSYFTDALRLHSIHVYPMPFITSLATRSYPPPCLFLLLHSLWSSSHPLSFPSTPPTLSLPFNLRTHALHILHTLYPLKTLIPSTLLGPLSAPPPPSPNTPPQSTSSTLPRSFHSLRPVSLAANKLLDMNACKG